MKDELMNTKWKPPMSEDLLEQSYQAVWDELIKNDKGAVVNCLENCTIALQFDPILGGHIRSNLFTERMTIDCPMPWARNGDAIDDTDLAFIQLHLEQHYGLKLERQVVTSLKIVSAQASYHPVRDKLRSLKWDGVPRIREALHHFLGAEVNDFNEKCLRVFMLGAVKRVFDPGCKFELMLVLVGGQGAGKTTFIRYLAMDPDWFTDGVGELNGKEIYHTLRGHWICELSEMVATANAKSIEEIKSFLSRDRDFCRLAYDRFGGDHPRQCVFAGTTNRTDFLPMDRSGNRRFLPVEVDASKADCHILDHPEESRLYFEQMWAEIMVQYQSGKYEIHLSKEEESSLLKVQEAYSQEDTLAGQIYQYLETFEGDKVCSLQIYKQGLDHEFDQPKNYETREIREIVNTGIANGILKGWVRFENPRSFGKYGRQRGWTRIMDPPKLPVPDPAQMEFTVITDDPDLPWQDKAG